MTDPCLLPSACHDGIDTPNYIAFAAQYLACTPPCHRLACCLAAVSRACLGFSVDLCSFTVTDCHPLPPAGLPGAPQLNTWPVVSPVNASRRPSRDAAHHSGSGRMASPYPIGDFHLLFFASFPGALRVGVICVDFGMFASRPVSG